MIPYGRQDIDQADIDSVVNVLKSDFLTQGPQVPIFEKYVSDYCGASAAVAVNSATSALHIACAALGLGKGDWLWTSPNTFVASANCGLYCGANIDFVDIDPATYNLCAEELEKKLIQAKIDKKLPKIVIAVHFAGQSCDMEKIYSLSKKYNFNIIEDASHAIGGRYQGKSIGCCQYSDITVFSFHPVKIVTTAEGGLATTNDGSLAEKMRLMRSHGITRDVSLMKSESEGDWYYQQIDLGFNYRMTELQAALGLSQMARIDEFVMRRHECKDYYDKFLGAVDVVTPFQGPDCYSALHLYPILLDQQNAKKSRQQVFRELRANGIGVNVHYIPVHTQPYYKEKGFKRGDFPKSEEYYQRVISIPLFPSLTREMQNEVVGTLKRILE
ncbi:MAG: UDP-4-amino-4,6-dideoxy-N-acetyl-beta-L-altrosamine transaminase [Alphaproteobacteria bacterium]